MPLGPGKYDDLCTYVREQTNADAALVIVLGGPRGSGFSMQGGIKETLGVAETLRKVADEIEKSMR